MGRCDEGPNCNYIEGRSIGFACTDETCFLNEGTSSFGDRPGQFDGITAIAIDRNDVLYVADGGNQRVQRFSPDGLFAGEAYSQEACQTCSGFVLGDFGRPTNISVNSSHFYVLDRQEGLVHIFEAGVVNQIDDTSAWVEYQSKSNYVGPDHFTFRATDGFRTADGELIESAPARVDINVARNFRPPIARSGLRFITPEDTPVAITLAGDDLDGDPLTYAVTILPRHGTLSGDPPNLTYTPVENYFGEDLFVFTVNDGMFTSEPEPVNIEVEWVNDPPVITPQASPIRAGLGHAVSLRAVIFDPDPDEAHTATVDWGDGTVESNGDYNPDGTLSGPIVTALVNQEAELLTYHTYAGAGTYPVNIKVIDAYGGEGTAQVQVIVEAMADLQLERSAAPLLPAGQQQFAFELLVSNPSANGVGIPAHDVKVSDVLTGSASYVAAIPNSGTCNAAGQTLSCDLGTLNPDQEVKIAVQVALNGAGVGALIEFLGEATSSTPDPLPQNNFDEAHLAIVPQGDFYVNSMRDGVDAAPGDGACATAEGLCTLRAAIMEANAQGGSRTIVLGSGVFVLELQTSAAGAHASDASAGDLDIDGDVVILGIGAERTAIHANGIDRVFEIHRGQVRIENLTISGGATTTQEGGALYIHDGNVTLRRVVISGNSAVNGGGVAHKSGVLRILESTVYDNSASSAGGGIFNSGELTVENSTISGNRADGGGGLLAVGGTAHLFHVTLVGNSADNAGGGINATGTSVRLSNSILTNNDAPIGPNCAPDLVSGGYNLLGTLDMCTLSGDTAGNLLDVIPGLDLLTENELETYSYSLNPDSPAIQRVPAARCATTDQRGALRNTEEGCDIGSTEVGKVDAGLFLPTVSR